MDVYVFPVVFLGISFSRSSRPTHTASSGQRSPTCELNIVTIGASEISTSWPQRSRQQDPVVQWLSPPLSATSLDYA